MIEREIKSLVSDGMLENFKNILDSVATPVRIVQINYYFDTPDLILNSSGNTLRIRQKKDGLLLQYKYDKQYTNKEKTCKEYEKSLTSFPLLIPSNDLPNFAPDSTIFFTPVGNLITERIDYIYNYTTVSLDENYYLGKCDNEIEVEFKQYEDAEKILKLLSIENIETSDAGKYSRFVNELKRLQGDIM